MKSNSTSKKTSVKIRDLVVGVFNFEHETKRKSITKTV